MISPTTQSKLARTFNLPQETIENLAKAQDELEDHFAFPERYTQGIVQRL